MLNIPLLKKKTKEYEMQRQSSHRSAWDRFALEAGNEMPEKLELYVLSLRDAWKLAWTAVARSYGAKPPWDEFIFDKIWPNWCCEVISEESAGKICAEIAALVRS